MKKPESRLQRRIRLNLEREVGGFWCKIHGGPFQKAGLPDLLGFVAGLGIMLEVKRPDDPKSKTSQVQKDTMEELRMLGGILTGVVTNEFEAVTLVREYLAENETVPLPVPRKVFRPRKAERRIVHGAGDWENLGRPVGHRRKVGFGKAPPPHSSHSRSQKRRTRVVSSDRSTSR